jgi:membrane associated rhomboid family serine protease
MAGRFSFQMPEQRNPSRPWFRIGQLEVTTTVLLTLLGAASLVLWAISQRASLQLALIPELVRQGQVWRLASWPFANQPTLWTIIGLAIFWYFGRELEGLIGRNRFAWLLTFVTIVPAVAATLLLIPQAGFRPLQFAVFLLFIAQYPFAKFFFGIPAWALGAVLLGLELLQLVGLRDTNGIIFLFASLLTAAVVGRSYGLLEGLGVIPALPLPGSGRMKKERRPKAPRPPRSRSRQSETVVAGPWDPPAVDRSILQAELDGLLDKISAEGMDSLTADEKRRLNDLSKRLR